MTFKACALWRFSPTPQNDSGDFIYLLVAPDLEYSPLERGGVSLGLKSRITNKLDFGAEGWS